MALQSYEFLNARCRINFGCEYDVALDLNGGRFLYERGSKARKYREQMDAAKARAIPWQMTFPVWVQLWVASGRWEERGTRKGQYVMARHGDEGPYHPENVSIQLGRENIKFAMTHAVWSQAATRLGRGKGWSPGKNGKFQACFLDKHLGHYDSKEQAIAVYLAAVEQHRRDHPDRFLPHRLSEIKGSHGYKFCPAEPLNTTQLIGETL